MKDQLFRWDNPMPMFCQTETTSRLASWHSMSCHNDAAWILVRNGEAKGFLCDACRQQLGLVPA